MPDAFPRSLRAASKRGRHGEQRSRDSSQTSSLVTAPSRSNGRISPPLETPRVLTRSAITGLTHGLDASDVLECYSLVRSAPLHGVANSTITVQKMTIGIRFRPTAADLKNPYNTKTPMELTLEYGPARLGPLLSDEAMPTVQGNDKSSSYLVWDNIGKVYFTQKIDAGNYINSNYMASMTGAVLNKLLHEAVGYTEKRKIYQPFSVYSDKGKRLMRSSSSMDFAWYVWSHLARLGVEIEPILSPSMYEARLYAKSANKVFPDPASTRAAASFYEHLYGCLESIASRSVWSSGKSSQLPGDNVESNGVDKARDKPSSSSGANNSDGARRGNRRLEDRNDGPDWETREDGNGDYDDDDGDTIDHDDDVDVTALDTDEEGYDDNGDDNGEIENEKDLQDDDVRISSSYDEARESGTTSTQEVPKRLPSNELPNRNDPTPGPSETTYPTALPTEGIHDVEKAQNAAMDAQKAADEAMIAAQTEGETKAADAAQAAADAALVAADATSSAAAQAAMDNLLSGDGALMSSIVSTCFSNPTYGISSTDSNGTATTEFYLFRDPSTYYKLELVSPYLEIAKLDRTIPNAATLLSGMSAGGDALDWTLALSILFIMFLMVLLICQQMGKHYIEAIFRCQRWFFNPRKYDYEGSTISGVQSGSHFFFGKRGIPISMGGRRSPYAEDIVATDGEPYRDNAGDEMDNDKRLTMSPEMPRKLHRNPSMELEMTGFSSPQHEHHPLTPRNISSKQSWRLDHSNSDHSSTGSSEEGFEKIPTRLLRNPDLVEMPSLKSKSKVAIPVGSSSNGKNNQHASNANATAYRASPSFEEGIASM